MLDLIKKLIKVTDPDFILDHVLDMAEESAIEMGRDIEETLEKSPLELLLSK